MKITQYLLRAHSGAKGSTARGGQLMGLSGFPQGLQTPALDLSLVFYKSRKPNNLNLDLWKPYTPHPQTMNPKPFTLEPKALSQKGRGARVPVVPGGARLLLRTSFCLPLALPALQGGQKRKVKVIQAHFGVSAVQALGRFKV